MVDCVGGGRVLQRDVMVTNHEASREGGGRYANINVTLQYLAWGPTLPLLTKAHQYRHYFVTPKSFAIVETCRAASYRMRAPREVHVLAEVTSLV